MNATQAPPQPQVGGHPQQQWGMNDGEHPAAALSNLGTSPSGTGIEHTIAAKGSKGAHTAIEEPKDLSHVPCKFFRANTCTAGKACPFSHDLPVPGTTKPICQWFAKGNCKFGHKCALAHVLPGQPMSFDRKNKRAAQQALRDAQAAANGHIPQSGTSPQCQPNGSALTQTLRQSGGDPGPRGDMTAYYLAQREQLIANANAAAANLQDGVFGSPDSVGRHTPATSPQMQGRVLPHDMSHTPLHFATIARGPTATFVAPATSGLSHHFGSPPSTTGRSTVAAQAMLSEQARRLSSTSDSLSPPRLQHLSRARVSYNGSNGPEYGASPPLAVPGTNGGVGPTTSSAAGIFGTSPFSSSRGLFMPSSYDSNEDGFPRSPPMRHAILPGDGIQRSSSGASWRNVAAVDDEAEDDGEDFDEGFLPSSLNDLLTPEEMRRRTLRAQAAPNATAHGPSSLSSRNAFDPISNSVPADLLLAAGKPFASGVDTGSATIPAPTLGERSVSAMSPPVWPTIGSSSPRDGASLLTQSRTREATLVAASPPTINSAGRIVSPTTASLLSSALSGARPPPQPTTSHIQSSPNLAAPVTVSGATFGMYSASFSGAPAIPSAAHLGGASPPTGPSTLRNSSSLASELAGIAVPGSLPTGLAAGLSRLHLVPPAHTGETPPSQSGSYFGSISAAPASSRLTSTSPFGVTQIAPPDSGVGLTSIGSPLRSELQQQQQYSLKSETDKSAASRRDRSTTPNGNRRSSDEASNGGRADDDYERADEGDVEIQFDMEVA
ncbi:hypothetical protein JCM10908_004541 [Rhodotorula pacifica]|uniref:Lee1p n=1 Tax=Rhodotorula pacifica TaxID=1495444 RepID=UPI00317B0859